LPPRASSLVAQPKRGVVDRVRGYGRSQPWRRAGYLVLAVTFDLAIAVGLALLPLLFLWRLLTDRAVDAAVLPLGDFTELHLPYRRFVYDELLAGRVPFWNPYVSTGHPTVGDPQSGVFYPLNWLMARLNPAGLDAVGLSRTIAIHFALASVFTYGFVRSLCASRVAGIVAALVFTYSGYLTSFPMQQLNVLETSVWLPLILWGIWLAIRANEVLFFAAAGIPLGVAALAGHPQTTGYVLAGTALFGGYLLVRYGLSLRRLVGLAVTFAVGAGISALQVVPILEHLGQTERADVGYDYTRAGYALPEMLALLWPGTVGGQSLYLGIATLVLVALAIVHRNDARGEKVFWLALAAFGLVLALGGNAFVQPALYATTPGLHLFRHHERAVFLVALAVAVLAGIGARALVERRGPDLVALRRMERPVWIVAGAFWIVAALLFYGSLTAPNDTRGALQGWLERGVFAAVVATLTAGVVMAAVRGTRSVFVAAGLFALIAFDLFSTNWQNNLRPGDPADLFPHTHDIAFLRSVAAGERFRIASEGLLPGNGNSGSFYELEDLVGNSPLETELTRQFEKNVAEVERWRLLNVRYIFTRRTIDDPRLLPVSKDGDVSLYELREDLRLPRAYLVHRALIAANDAEAFRLLRDARLDEEVVLSEWPGALDGRAPSRPVWDGPPLVVERLTPTDLTLDAYSSRASVLVMSELDYPGWQARVNGVPARAFRANGALRALYLEPGWHEISWTFDPPGYAVGADLAGRTVSALIWLVVIRLVWELVYRLARWRIRRPVAAPSLGPDGARERAVAS
jgi:hypothetical protein